MDERPTVPTPDEGKIDWGVSPDWEVRIYPKTRYILGVRQDVVIVFAALFGMYCFGALTALGLGLVKL